MCRRSLCLGGKTFHSRALELYKHMFTRIQVEEEAPLGNYVLDQPWQRVCWITPGKLCLGSLLGNYVLHQPLETVCCQLWSSAFGSPALVPGFGPTWPMAHGPLGQDVLHHVWHTMCCISAWKLCVASPLGDDGGV